MPTQGPFAPGSITELSTAFLTNASGMTASGGAAAVWGGAYTYSANRVILGTFGFTIPGTATIQGVEISDLRIRSTMAGVLANPTNHLRIWTTPDSGATLSPSQLNVELSGVTGGSFVQAGPLGGSSTLLSLPLTPTQVNNSTFGLQLGLVLGGAGADVIQFEIDHITLKIHYSDAGSGPAILAAADADTYIPGIGVRDSDFLRRG